jgi:hypothetical protein
MEVWGGQTHLIEGACIAYYKHEHLFTAAKVPVPTC